MQMKPPHRVSMGGGCEYLWVRPELRVRPIWWRGWDRGLWKGTGAKKKSPRGTQDGVCTSSTVCVKSKEEEPGVAGAWSPLHEATGSSLGCGEAPRRTRADTAPASMQAAYTQGEEEVPQECAETAVSPPE